VFGVQLGLIYWLGKPQPLPPPLPARPADFPPSLSLSGPAAADVLALSDPTLFALPHRENFSGPAWLNIREQEPPVIQESTPWLALDQEQLGDELQNYMATNRPTDASLFDKSDLRLKQPLVPNTQPFSTPSTLRLRGDLTRRRLLNPPSLPAWPSADILTNTVVDVLVAADGIPIRPTLHVPAGFPEADRYALREVRKARFEPLLATNPANPLEGLVWGQFVFEWQTLPLHVTNNPALPGAER
jgi:hypothetical protein